jgi:hypothetical protein
MNFVFVYIFYKKMSENASHDFFLIYINYIKLDIKGSKKI